MTHPPQPAETFGEGEMREEIARIVKNYRISADYGNIPEILVDAVNEVMALLDRHTAALLARVEEEVIGNTESLDDCPIEKHLCDKVTRNVFRSEQRKRLSTLRRGEGEGNGDAHLS